MCSNAPHGARCCLDAVWGMSSTLSRARLNAPYGARCFLTKVVVFDNLMDFAS